MAEILGTMPAIKQRPKVAKRPTILALPPQKPSPKTVQKPAAAKQDRIAGQKPVEGRRKSGTRADIPLNIAQPVNEPVCAIAVSAVPGALEPAKAAALAVPDISQITAAPAGPVSSTSSTIAAVSSTLTVSTIPPVRERPKVARKPTIAASKAGSKAATRKTTGKTEAAAKEKQPALATNWINWAPLAAGIVLGFLSPQLHSLASLWDPWGLRIVFPFVQVLGLREIGIGDELNRSLPQLMLYLQFPLEGLLVAMNLRQGRSLAMAIGPLPGLHFVCGLVLWIVALGSLKPI